MLTTNLKNSKLEIAFCLTKELPYKTGGGLKKSAVLLWLHLSGKLDFCRKAKRLRGSLSKLLVKNTDGVYTKYVYGNGLICEETNEQFKTYHFDYRGSTVAITDSQGNVTDRFKYNTYGKVTEHTGNSDVIFKYNGRDGVITEPNGLYYMISRYLWMSDLVLQIRCIEIPIMDLKLIQQCFRLD